MKSVLRAGAAALIAGAVSGCVPIIGAFTLGDLYTGTSLVATGLTGKSLTDDALGAVTGEDCSVMGAVLEKDRKLCEEHGAKVTQADFKGLIGASENPAQPQQAAADVPTDTQAGASPVALDAEADTPAAASPYTPLAAADMQAVASMVPPRATAVAQTRAGAGDAN